MCYLLDVYKAKARELVALFRSGDIGRDEFEDLKQNLLDPNNIEKQLDQDARTITADQIIQAVTVILSAIK
jgi:hypothetical protein